MTFEELVQEIALGQDLPMSRARETIKAVFDEIRYQALRGQRVNIPKFGVFDSRFTRAGKRPVGGFMKSIPATKRVTFRVSTGAKMPGITKVARLVAQ